MKIRRERKNLLNHTQSCTEVTRNEMKEIMNRLDEASQLGKHLKR